MSIEEFASKLGAHQSGALPDGCYQATLKHVVWQEEKRKLRLIGLLDNEREVHQVISRAKPATVEKWNALHGQRVLVQVRRIPRTGQVTGSFRPADGTVVGFGGVRMTDEGEIKTSGKVSATRQARTPTTPDLVEDPDTAAHSAFPAAVSSSSIDEPARAYHHHEQLLTGLATTRRGLADIAEACYQIQQGKLWTALGYDRLADYLSDPDITLTRREFFRAAAIHEAYVSGTLRALDPEVLELAPASKWEAALPGASDASVPDDDLIADVQTLGIRDLRARYRGEDEECDDAPAARCETCGQTLRRAA